MLEPGILGRWCRRSGDPAGVSWILVVPLAASGTRSALFDREIGAQGAALRWMLALREDEAYCLGGRLQ